MQDDDPRTWAEVGRRVRALRRAGGYENTGALTAKLNLPRFGAKTLGEVERGKRQLFPHERAEVARVLEVDETDISHPKTGTQLDRIEALLQGNARMIEMVLAAAGVKSWEQAATMRVPGFPEGIAELLRPQADTPPHSQAEDA